MEREKLRADAERIRRLYLDGEISYEDAVKQLKPFKKAFDEYAKERAKEYNISKPQKMNIDMYLKMKGIPIVSKEEKDNAKIMQDIEKQAISHRKLIYIGLDEDEKLAAIKQYLDKNEITNIVYFYPCGMRPMDLSCLGIEVEYRTFWDIIRYVFNTPLLENVNEKYLVIYDEMLRVKGRRDLTYNTTHHVANQAGYVITFNRFPIISDKEDWMILVDLSLPNKWSMQKYSRSYIDLPEVYIKPVEVDFDIIKVKISNEDKKRYEEMKCELFDQLGKKDPDTVPRTLQIYAGTLKKKAIEDGKTYIARNARFKRDNVKTWKEFRLFDSMTQCAGSGQSKHHGKIITADSLEDAYIIDTPTSDIEFIDFLRLTGVKHVYYLSTGLPVDKYYVGCLQEFFDSLKEFYEEVGW